MALFRRIGWTVGDQALSSATNFALGLVLVRSVPTESFGIFTLTFASYLVMLGITRAITSEPLLIRFANVDKGLQADAARSVTGVGLVVGAFGALVFISGSLIFMQGTPQWAFVILGLSLPGLLLQDTWRYVFFTQGRPFQAFLNDLIWAVGLLLLLVLEIVLDVISTPTALLAWGAAGGVAGAFGLVQARLVPRVRSAREWWRRQADLAPRFLGEFGAIIASSQAALFVIGAIAGLAAVGEIRAGQLLLNPLNVLFFSAGPIAIPVLARLASRPSGGELYRATISGALGLGVLAMIWGGVLLAAPDAAGHFILGDAWSAARPLLLPLTLWMVGAGFTLGIMLGLRAVAAARESFRARLLSSPLAAIGGAVGAKVDGGRGAAWGLALASLGQATVWLFHLKTVSPRGDSE